jgi:Protein of unknown function (DUF2934)
MAQNNERNESESERSDMTSTNAPASSDGLRRQIAEAAYYRAQQRGFSPGYEEKDWLEAEAQVMAERRKVLDSAATARISHAEKDIGRKLEDTDRRAIPNAVPPPRKPATRNRSRGTAG